MKRMLVGGIGLAALVFTGDSRVSGLVGTYAIVEKVVFEPNAKEPERVQVWGAFALVDYGFGKITDSGRIVSPPQRGYMYFKLPADARISKLAKTEWADLQAVAGTGQAVAFGEWFYTGRYSNAREIEAKVRDRVRIRPDSAKVAGPDDYITNAGLVKITAKSHAELVEQLKKALEKKEKEKK
jgi:hypothetical protein